MDKGWEQIAAALGILAAGAAYVPIDPKLPIERRCYLLQEAEIKQVITQSWLDSTLDWPQNITRICVDRLEPSVGDFPPPFIPSPTSLAYIIYTSGSTGLPKGVMIDHQGAVNTIVDINNRFHVTFTDRVIALSSLSFDLSVYDIFGTLAAGATIIIPDADAAKNPEHWVKLMVQHQVSIWNSVPALMQMLCFEVRMRPMVPVFPQTSSGSTALDYLSLARQYQAAAIQLSGYINGQINWPAYTLVFHGCELALKAYNLQHASGVRLPKHSLKDLYAIASRHSFSLSSDSIAALDVLEDMHADHWPRYPDNRSGRVLDVEALADDLLETLIRAVSASF